MDFSEHLISRRTLLAGMSAASAQFLAATKLDGPLEFWTLAQAAAALRRRAISSEEMTKLCLARIHRIDPLLNSFITVTEESALAQARDCDARLAKRPKDTGPLFGIPIALKDNIDIAGFDPLDSIAADAPVPDYVAGMRAPLANLRLGIARDYFFEGLNAEVAEAVESAIQALRPKFRSVRDMALPRFRFVPSGSYDVELLHFQKPYLEATPELYHPWSRRQLTGLQSTTVLAYVETLKRVRECRRDIRRVFEEVDVLVMPTKRDVAPTIQATVDETYRRPPSNTSAMNRFGTPAISVPCGFSKDSLPIGLQIVGPRFGEARVLAVAYAYQEMTDWHRRHPSV